MGLIAALASPLLVRVPRLPVPLLLAAFPAWAFVSYWQAGSLESRRPWVSSLSIDLAFRQDSFSLVFCLLICGIGALVLLYAQSYMTDVADKGRFYAMFMGFMTAMLGLVTAGNTVTLFVAWELTSITSYFLIGHKTKYADARASARQALLVTGSTGLCLLAGLLMLNHGDANAAIGSVTAKPGTAVYLAAAALLFIGCFGKSAQFPFQFWLPNAMSAPSPVSAYLHSTTLVLGGVYLLARLMSPLAEHPPVGYVLVGIGLATSLLATIQSVGQSDLKRLLAMSTTGALGLMVTLIGIGTPAAAVALVAFLVAHAFYKAAMFLVAGAIEHEIGTRDIDQLRGLFWRLPLVSVAAMLAGLSMLGLAPTTGFVAKEAALETAFGQMPILGAAMALSAVGYAVTAWLMLRLAFTKAEEQDRHFAPGLAFSPLSLGLLASFGVPILMLLPGVKALLQDAAESVIRGAGGLGLPAVWHGLSPAFLAGTTGVVVGVLLAEARFRRGQPLTNFANGFAEIAFDRPLANLRRVAVEMTAIFHHGSLRTYLATSLAAIVVVVTGGYLISGPVNIDLPTFQPSFTGLTVAGLAAVSALAILRSRSRLGVVAMLGIIGFAVSVVFVQFGAPDLSLTQIVTDTLTVLLFVFVFYHLPGFSVLTTPGQRFRDILVAGGFGLMMSVAIMLVVAQEPARPIRDAVAAMSWPLAYGRNVVNVVIVDFRGLDTLGEITVLGLAAIGVFTLLRHRAPKVEGSA